MKIAFLGGGNMAGALIGGLLAKGYPAADLSVVEVVPQARENLAARYKVHVSEAADAVTLAADTLVLAVKPQDMKKAVAPLAGRLGQALVISIAAGIRLEDLSRWLGGHSRLVRVMPNTPALVGEGMAGLFARPEVSADEKKRAESILGAVGKTVWVDDEALIDPVTAVSGSGPAYVFYFIEALEKAGAQLGLVLDQFTRGQGIVCRFVRSRLGQNVVARGEQLGDGAFGVQNALALHLRGVGSQHG